MTFLKCTIGGVQYGEITGEDAPDGDEGKTAPGKEEKNSSVSVLRQFMIVPWCTEQRLSVILLCLIKGDPKRLDFTSWNPYADEDFKYYDKDFLDKCRSGENRVSY